MRQIRYTLQFHGQATRRDTAGTVMKATTTAPSCTHATTINAEGVQSTLRRMAGETATFASTVHVNDNHTFREEGTISFGTNGHRLHFSTVGHGYLDACADPALQHGTVMWRVDGGEGQFAGASGLITSNFFVSTAGEVTDHHYGVIFVQ